MSSLAYDTKLTALPFRYFQIDQDIIIKRGRVELKISGPDAVDVLLPAIEVLLSKSTTIRELCSITNNPALIEDFVQHLVQRRLITVDETINAFPRSQSESAVGVFSWEIDTLTRSQRLPQEGVIIVGVNAITHEAALSLMSTPDIGSLIVVDDPALRNNAFVDDNGVISIKWNGPTPHSLSDFASLRCEATLLLAASEIGREVDLLYWNAFCLQRRLRFLPVSLRDWIGTIGPLTFPGETACLQCARTRQEANDDALDRRIEFRSSFPGVVGAHPSMAPILGHLASVELFKARMLLPGTRFGQILEVNLMSSRVTPRKILKVPRCKECSPTGKFPRIAIEGSNHANPP